MAVELTEKAAEKVRGILEAKGTPDAALRVFVQGGGCSGFQYGMSIDQAPHNGDKVFESHGVKVLVDPKSYLFINGAVVDFADSIFGGGFKVENPNAVASCGCGHSFQAQGHEQVEGKACH